MRHSFNAFVLGCALAAGASAAAAAADLSLDDVVERQGAFSLQFPHVLLAGANITEAEARTLFDADAPRPDRETVLAKLRASKITIPTAVLIFRQGRLTLSGLEAAGVAAGQADHVSIASGEFEARGASGGRIEGRLRPAEAEGVDLHGLLEPGAPDKRAGQLRANEISSSGFAALVRSPVGPNANKESRGGWTVDLGHFHARNSYRNGLAVKTAASFDHLSIAPTPGGAAADSLKRFGYDAIDVGLAIKASYEPDKRAYRLDDLTLTGDHMGRISIHGALKGVAAAGLDGGLADRRAALANSDLVDLTVDLVNSGLFDRVLAWYAERQNAATDSVRRQWASTAAVAIPFFMRGDPASLVLAQAVSAFIEAPKDLKVTVKAKQDGVRLGDLAALSQTRFSSKLQLDVEAPR